MNSKQSMYMKFNDITLEQLAFAEPETHEDFSKFAINSQNLNILEKNDNSNQFYEIFKDSTSPNKDFPSQVTKSYWYTKRLTDPDVIIRLRTSLTVLQSLSGKESSYVVEECQQLALNNISDTLKAFSHNANYQDIKIISVMCTVLYTIIEDESLRSFLRTLLEANIYFLESNAMVSNTTLLLLIDPVVYFLINQCSIDSNDKYEYDFIDLIPKCSIEVSNRILNRLLNNSIKSNEAWIKDILYDINDETKNEIKRIFAIASIGGLKIQNKKLANLLHEILKQTRIPLCRDVTIWALSQIGSLGQKYLVEESETGCSSTSRSFALSSLMNLLKTSSNELPFHVCLICQFSHKSDGAIRPNRCKYFFKKITGDLDSTRCLREGAMLQIPGSYDPSPLEQILNNLLTGKSNQDRWCLYIAVDSIQALNYLKVSALKEQVKDVIDKSIALNLKINSSLINEFSLTKIIHKHVNDINYSVRSSLATSLSIPNNSSIFPHAIQMHVLHLLLQDEHPIVREKSCESCKSLGYQMITRYSSCILPSLFHLLKDTFHSVRLATINALSSFGEPVATQLYDKLIDLLKISQLSKPFILSSIHSLGSTVFSKLFHEFQDSKCPLHVRIAIVQSFQSKEYLNWWKENIHNLDNLHQCCLINAPRLMAICIKTYGYLINELYQQQEISPKRFHECLHLCWKKLQGSNNPEICHISAWVLSQSGPHGESLLVKCVFNQNISYISKKAAIHGLRRVGLQTLQTILLTLQDEHQQVQQTAIEILSQTNISCLKQYLDSISSNQQKSIAYLAYKAKQNHALMMNHTTSEFLEILSILLGKNISSSCI